ncbi:beta-1,4 N-acetylgalactosaminyltransferase 1-like [Ptychodera flava]|uniref:beta-1,4 N-acetylgalactosaminyltransferase 1-like n=1 Tax=Ptychodera flava TaxID=63121 RepID=UPI00396A9915
MNYSTITVFVAFAVVVCDVFMLEAMQSHSSSTSDSNHIWNLPFEEWKNQPQRDLTDEGDKLQQKMVTEGGSCSCSDLHVPGKIHGGQMAEGLKLRRAAEMEKWRKERAVNEEPLVTCRMLSPLSYVGGVLTVEPLKMVRVVGLSVAEKAIVDLPAKDHADKILTIYSTKKLGTLTVDSPFTVSENCKIKGNDTDSLEIAFNAMSITIDDINSILQTLVFKSTYYDIHIREILEVKLSNFNINVHIEIRRERRPKIYGTHYDDDIIKKVTVVTKTFERYECVDRLVRSVNQYYPGMQILIADDSEIPEEIVGSNVQQFIMPYKEGWFAGRNLVLSQVKTKYFVWVDDDFIFTENTKLENFLEKFEDPRIQLDMIGAFFEDVNGTKYILSLFFKNIEIYAGDEDGDCMMRNRGFQRYLEEYPECMIVDLVTNFFMAKTLSVRAVGFDPQFERVGHTEHFVDAFGHLRIASCRDVFIIHKSDKNNVKYAKFRRGGESSPVSRYYGHDQYILFKNNFKCYRLG